MKSDDILSELQQQIDQGLWKSGEKLPTERELAEKYGVSRPTISKVFDRLRESGQIRRVVGAGTFLSQPVNEERTLHKTFGLFIPGLGLGEIFEPVCARIAELSDEFNFTLTWGSLPTERAEDNGERLQQTAQRFIDHGVDGVFLQPTERESDAVKKNLIIVSMFEEAGIPLVLLDSDYLEYPQRSDHDLVGIDNIQAAFVLCNHFLEQKRPRVDFVWKANTANTHQLRLIGYREALYRAGISPQRAFEHEGDPDDLDFVRELTASGAKDIICVNDETAAHLMRSLECLDLKVPEQVRIAGFDDVKYARLAAVPLTTMRQPCRALGDLILRAMIERIENPRLPPRTITATATLCKRKSSEAPRQEA